MKKRLLAGLLSGCIVLSGCASMLERDYVSVSAHSSTKTDVGTSSILRVENYPELVNSLIYFITNAEDQGVIRLYMDAASAEEMLYSARQEIMTEYPPAVYAVESISFHTDALVTYAETDVSFTYRRSPQQVASIVTANGLSAVRNVLSSAMKGFAGECVLNINYFDQDEAFIRSLIRQAYYSAPAAALEYPEVEVNIYPDSGRQRIVEVLFRYNSDISLLSQQAILLEQACERTAQSITRSSSSAETALAAAQAILAEGGHDNDGGSSAYYALLGGGANSEGLSLAMAAVCAKLSIPCKVAEGYLGDMPHFWNVVYTENGWRHIDLSQLSQGQNFRTDEQWRAGTYQWIESTLPACG